jgi:hypothetical protein
LRCAARSMNGTDEEATLARSVIGVPRAVLLHMSLRRNAGRD